MRYENWLSEAGACVSRVKDRSMDSALVWVLGDHPSHCLGAQSHIQIPCAHHGWPLLSICTSFCLSFLICNPEGLGLSSSEASFGMKSVEGWDDACGETKIHREVFLSGVPSLQLLHKMAIPK